MLTYLKAIMVVSALTNKRQVGGTMFKEQGELLRLAHHSKIVMMIKMAK